MATADDYARWIVANPDKKGTPEFETVVAAYRDAMSSPKTAQTQTKYDPSAGGSTLQVYNPFGKNLDTGINTSESVDRFLSGAGSGMTDLVKGVGQRLGMVDQASIDEKKKLDAPLKSTTAGTVGNISGKTAMMLPTVWIPGSNTLAGSAVIGGGQGFVEPTASGESVAKNVALGSLGGAVGNMAGRALGAAWQGGKSLMEPFFESGRNKIAGRVLNEFAQDPTAVAAASGNPTITGALPTLAEETKDVGISQLQRALISSDPQAANMIAQRLADNNAARIGQLQTMAGSTAQRAAAEDARRIASSESYNAAKNATYTVDGKLQDLLSRPAVQQAMARAKTIAANQGRPFTFAVESKAPFSGVGGNQSVTTNQITGQGLQDLKMAMDEMLTDPASGFSGQAGNTIKSLRGQLLGWMEDANPAFKQARTAYAEASKPINAMDVGQRLLDKTTSATRDFSGNTRLQANAFARALNDEKSLVQKATDFKGIKSLEDVMTPEQINMLNAIRNESETVANVATAGNAPGSPTAQRLASQNILRQIAGPTGMPKSWVESTLLNTAMRPVQFVYNGVAEPKLQQTIADVLLNPKKAAEVLKAANKGLLSPAQKRIAQAAGLLANQSVPAGLLAAYASE